MRLLLLVAVVGGLCSNAIAQAELWLREVPHAGLSLPDESSKPVIAALQWLGSKQETNGSWQHQPGLTGLATVSYLAAGVTPLDEQFGNPVQDSIQWLATTNPTQRPLDDVWLGLAIGQAYQITQIPFLHKPAASSITHIFTRWHSPSDRILALTGTAGRQELWDFFALSSHIAEDPTQFELVSKATHLLEESSQIDLRVAAAKAAAGVPMSKHDRERLSNLCVETAKSLENNTQLPALAELYELAWVTRWLAGHTFSSFRKILHASLLAKQKPEGNWSLMTGIAHWDNERDRPIASTSLATQILLMRHGKLPFFAYRKSKAEKAAEAAEKTRNAETAKQKLQRDLNDLKARAAEGDSASMVKLAMQYYYGSVVPHDEQKAFSLLRLAAEKGNSNAKYMLLTLDVLKYPDLLEDPIAKRWFIDIEDRDTSDILRLRAHCFHKGIIVAQNHQRAFSIYLRLANKQDLLGVMMVASYFEHGWHGNKDPVQAYAWYKVGAQSTDLAATVKLVDFEAQLTSAQIQEAERLVPSLLKQMNLDIKLPNKPAAAASKRPTQERRNQ